MEKMYRRLRGVLRMEIFGAFPESMLNACAMQGLEVWELECVDAYTLRFSIYESDRGELCSCAERSMCEIKCLGSYGGSSDRRRLKSRLALLVLAAVAVAAVLLSSLFVWQIDVRGNRRLTSAQILRTLSDCGVYEGCFWPGISADLVRSRMLMALPDIGWMTVNVSGSRAIVLVLEREEKPEIYQDGGKADIIAKRAGVVTRVSALCGKPLVCEGSAVSEGDVLISGSVDSMTSEATQVRALGSVTAETWYELTAYCPAKLPAKKETVGAYSRFALKLGKNRYNFYISDEKDIDECDKIVYEYRLGIDGLFSTPIALVRERVIPYKADGVVLADREELKAALISHINMGLDGVLLESSFTDIGGEELAGLCLRCRCEEDISVISRERTD